MRDLTPISLYSVCLLSPLVLSEPHYTQAIPYTNNDFQPSLKTMSSIEKLGQIELSTSKLRLLALLITFFTGFTGLVYEVTWHRYLATLLGSQSEATAAILGIFLGGLAVGYRLFGNYTRGVLQRCEATGQPARLLARYGVLEIGIGVYAILFPLTFLAVQAFSFNIPHSLDGVGFLFDVFLSILLIGFPTVLMGGTIPFLTQGLAKDMEDSTRIHSYVYGINTLGAFLGALTAVFVLIPTLGLIWVMIAMGIINIVAGGIFLILDRSAPDPLAAPEEEAKVQRSFALFAFAAIALLTGFAMMTVQTAAIRLGALSLGASDFTFGMVVSIFVMCIAIGSFLVSFFKRIPRSTVLINQWLLAAALIWLYVELAQAPYYAHQLRILFTSMDGAFTLYHVGVFIGIFALLAIPVLLSGASLPLLFNHMREKFDGLGAVAGKLYSWNTVGSFLGALLSGYALLFWLDLYMVYMIGLIAAILSALLLGFIFTGIAARGASLVMTAVLATIMSSLQPWTSEELSPGLFRFREALPFSTEPFEEFKKQWWAELKTPFYEDGPSVSAMVKESTFTNGEMMRSIIVNGKSDSATHGERPTVGLLGILPALFADRVERAFVIGYGTGFTVGEIAALEENEEVVVAEISPAVMNAAPLFDFANRNTSTNPKVSVVHTDAYRALIRDETQYDIIVSEPSNPWVTGVEMLYSVEFLKAARNRLTDKGVFVQWFHQYETSDAALEMVLNTYKQTFEHVSIWHGLGFDLLLLGFNDPEHALDLERLQRRTAQADFADGLRRSEVDGLLGLLAHEIMPLGVLHELDFDTPLQTLLHPRLNDLSAQGFFKGAAARLPFSGTESAQAIGKQNSLLRRYMESGNMRSNDRHRIILQACKHRNDLCTALFADWYTEMHRPTTQFQQVLNAARQNTVQTFRGAPNSTKISYLSSLLSRAPLPRSVPYSLAQQSSLLLKDYYHHAVPIDTDKVLDIWDRCAPPETDADACDRGRAQVEALIGHQP